MSSFYVYFQKTGNLFDDKGLFAKEETPIVDIFNKPPSPAPAKEVTYFKNLTNHALISLKFEQH